MRKSVYLIPILALAVIIGLSSIFIVDEREKALVLRFGRVVQVQETPGLAFKMPLVDEVVRYSDLILSRDLDPISVTPEDQRILIVDAFARYRIEDVTKFRQAVGDGGETAAGRSLDRILDDGIREVLGSVTSNDILSVDRAALMQRIRDRTDLRADNLGLAIIDVRLKRTDLPPENQTATFARMIAERDEEAADLRARGSEARQRIEAAADRTSAELLADANRDALITRGEADGERNRIFAEAFGADPEFFEFYRSMTAYQNSLNADNSTMVLSPDNEFFNYLKSDTGLAPPAAAEE
ncbi:protease modulator HflC [Yoonia sp. 2307UL14-13]|uniref:protease modulator HflC n=1 Tax=Yoonia sp. 2307UL14-13 TaxID=3126506 RepID=UPI0030A2F1E7